MQGLPHYLSASAGDGFTLPPAVGAAPRTGTTTLLWYETHLVGRTGPRWIESLARNCSDLRGSGDYSASCGGTTKHGISTANRFRPLKREQLRWHCYTDKHIESWYWRRSMMVAETWQNSTQYPRLPILVLGGTSETRNVLFARELLEAAMSSSPY